MEQVDDEDGGVEPQRSSLDQTTRDVGAGASITAHADPDAARSATELVGPGLTTIQRWRRRLESKTANQWMNISLALLTLIAVVVIGIRFNDVKANGLSVLHRMGLFDGPDARLTGTVRIQNLATGDQGSESHPVAVEAGDNLQAILEFENVGDDALPPTSEITVNWDPLVTETHIDGITTGSGGSIDFGIRVNGNFVTTIEGALAPLGISDPCTANMHLFPDDAFVYLDGADAPDRAIIPVRGDPNADHARVTTTIATLPLGRVDPGHKVKVEIPFRTSPTDDGADPFVLQTGGVVDARILGRTGSQTVLSVMPGDRVEVRATVFEQSCSDVGTDVLVRSPIKVDRTAGTAVVGVTARREGEADESSLGQVVLNMLNRASRVRVLPGSTTVSRIDGDSPACSSADAKLPTSYPAPVWGRPSTVADGIAQGGVNIGLIRAFTANDGCRGTTENNAVVRYVLVVE